MTIDLHGFNVEEATATLINALFSFRLDKYDNKLEIITGNGQGIIWSTVLDLLDEERIFYQTTAFYKIIIFKSDNPDLEIWDLE